MNTILQNARFIRAIDLIAPGQATNNGSAINVAGYHNVLAVAELGAATTATTVTLSIESGPTSAAFNALSGVTIATSEASDYLAGMQYLAAEVTDLSTDTQWIRPVIVTAGANCGIGGCMVILSNPRVQRPITQSSADGFAGQVLAASPTT